MNSYIDIKITGKNVRRFVLSLYKNKYNLYKINYIDDYVVIRLDHNDYLRLIELNTIYDINIIRMKGLIRYNYLIKKYKVFLFSCIFGIVFMFFLSRLILDIDIKIDSNEIKNIIYNDLDKYGIKRFGFVKSFDENISIKNKILKDNKEKIEWLEIERIGNKYIISVQERRINNVEEDTTPRNVVANKKGIIISIDASIGEVVKKVNDFVNPGDIIISGSIMNKEEVKGYVRATGKIIAESWYTVTVELPFNYKEEYNTGNEKIIFSFDFLNKKISNSSYKNKKRENIFVIGNMLLPIKFGIYRENEINVIDQIYTYDNAIVNGIEIAREKLLQSLGNEDTIIYEKCLKIIEKDSKILLDIFFKVREDITGYSDVIISNNSLSE